mmetsp:Transcript_7024/g.11109  ORF Transcript_7024/g.11109 Transcript_7024/m.11109 type:complete len:586 (+) Transcript_7024:2030-3787(+)
MLNNSIIGSVIEDFLDSDVDSIFKVDVVPYRKAASTEFMRILPRYGHTRDFASIFASKDEAIDYIQGLVIASIILLSVFLFWGILLLIFKCIGAKRVGFLAGSAFVRPEDPSVNYHRPFICRVVFLVSCLLFVLFSVLFNTEGVAHVYNSVDTAYDSTLNIAGFAAEATNVAIDLAKYGESSTALAKEINSFLEDEAGTKCLLDTGGFPFENGENIIEKVARTLSDMGDFLPSDYDGLTESLESVHKQLDDLSTEVNKPSLGKPYFLIFTIFYIIMPAILLVAVMAAWFEVDAQRLRCIISWLVLPIFCIQILLASILGGVFIMGAGANADFCSGGQDLTPNSSVMQILRNLGVNPESKKFQIFSFYVDQCQSKNNPFQSIKEYFSQLAKSQLEFQDLFEALNNVGATPSSGNEFTRKLVEDGLPCEVYADQMYGTTEALISNVDSLIALLVDIFDLLKCETIVPLYTKPTFEAACQQSVAGLTWIFVGFVVMASMGLIMVMLRSSWQIDVSDSDVFDEDEKENDDEYSSTNQQVAVYLSDETAEELKDNEDQHSSTRSDLDNNSTSSSKSPRGDFFRENVMSFS